MQALENEFKTPLFVRGGRGMTLTEAGQRLHEGLQGLERQLRSLKDDVAAALIEPSGEVAFGMTASSDATTPTSRSSAAGCAPAYRLPQKWR
jgi:LysR family nitrogen assimilation transcriptional regulator